MRARSKKQQHYITVARREYVTDDVEIDDNPRISPAPEDDGCWVAAWVWVSNSLAENHESAE